MGGIESWWEQGERVEIELRGVRRYVFVRRVGDGPTLTFLHGFPSSSHDWAQVAPPLAEHHALLLFDFLGHGASEKPADHDYSIHEQADLVEAVWAHAGIGATALVAHDYGSTVAQELLARSAEGALAVDVQRVFLLNAGLYPHLHRPEPVQTALLDPDQGPQIAAALNEAVLAAALRPTFGPGSAVEAAARDMWRALSRDDGHLVLPRLIRYILDRREHERRWVGALERTDLPLAFIWGMLDPVSGAHMAERIREGRPDARFVALEDVGHWPPLEAPERVAAEILARASSAQRETA